MRADHAAMWGTHAAMWGTHAAMPATQWVGRGLLEECPAARRRRQAPFRTKCVAAGEKTTDTAVGPTTHPLHSRPLSHPPSGGGGRVCQSVRNDSLNILLDKSAEVAHLEVRVPTRQLG